MDLMPEASSAPPAARRRYKWRSLTAGLLFLPLYLGSQIADAEGVFRPFVLAAGHASLVALVWLIYEFIHLMRQLDELQQRIHITSLAAGFGVVGTVLTTGGLMLTVWNVDALPDLVAIVAIQALPLGVLTYYIALHVVKRRYE